MDPGSERPPAVGRSKGLDRFDIHFCAEFAIPTRSGGGAASLCLLDRSPRRITAKQQRLIDDIARIAADHVESHEDLRAASAGEAAYRLLVDSSTDTIVRGGLDGVRSYVSPAVRTLLGYEPHELVGRKAVDLVHPDDIGSFKGIMAGFGSGSTALAVVEMRQRHKDGSYVWMEASIRLTRDPLTGSPDGYVTSVRDVSRRKMAEDRLSHIAGHDALTGLPNRATFQTRLADRLERFHRNGDGFALLCFDLDGFKSVNDGLGHPAGDDVLKTVSDRFRAIIGEGDTVARLGGDEFAILRVGGGKQPVDGLDLAARLVDATATPIPIGGARVQVGLSVGIAVPCTERASSEALFAAADQALMQVKRSGKNGFLMAGRPPACASRALRDGP